MEGVSEQHLVGMAAGLAMEGKIVYLNTIATFLTRRCFEQIALDLCYHNLPVRLIGNGGGMVYAPLGPTHLATDDIAICRALPNMTITAVSDANEMKRMMPLTVDHSGPMYIRLARGHDPIITPDDQDFRIGKTYMMRKPDMLRESADSNAHADALIITTGITLREALAAGETLAQQGIELAILHVPTIKPLDANAILQAITNTQAPIVCTIEEHNIIGGLGSAVAELLAENPPAHVPKFTRIGIPDVFPDRYGRQQNLIDHYNINAARIIEIVTQQSAMAVSS
jgi:transketolase